MPPTSLAVSRAPARAQNGRLGAGAQSRRRDFRFRVNGGVQAGARETPGMDEIGACRTALRSTTAFERQAGVFRSSMRAVENRPKRSSAGGRRVGPLLLRSGTALGSRLKLLHNRSCQGRGVPVSCRRGSAQLCRNTQAGGRPRVAGHSGAPTQALRALYGQPRRRANSREELLTRAAPYPAQLGLRSTGCVRRCADRGDGLPSDTQILPAAADVTFGSRIQRQVV